MLHLFCPQIEKYIWNSAAAHTSVYDDRAAVFIFGRVLLSPPEKRECTIPASIAKWGHFGTCQGKP
jgi:hypothetical protein